VTRAVLLARGHGAFDRRAWAEAFDQLSAADRKTPLDADDLERLAVAAHLTGRGEKCAEAWERAHHECLQRAEIARAARCAFWLAFGLLNGGPPARGGGWPGRGN
jgi:hypothetical protein